MKKTLAAALLITGLFSLTVEVNADASSAITEGDVAFQKDNTKEGGKEIVIPQDGTLIPTRPTKTDGTTMDGGKSDGALRIEFVPNFHFATQYNSSINQSYNAEFSTGWYETADGSKVSMLKSPLFAQVSDESGNPNSKWSLSVQQKTLFSDNTDTKILKNTRVHIYSVQYFNSNAAIGSGSTFVTPMNLIDGDYKEIPVTGGLTLMSADSKTNSSKTSVVFSDSTTYDPTISYEPTTTNNAGLQLFVPGNDVTEEGVTYTAEFEWTLTNAF